MKLVLIPAFYFIEAQCRNSDLHTWLWNWFLFQCLFWFSVKTAICVRGCESGFYSAFVLFMLSVKTAIYAHGCKSGSYSSICFVQAQCQNSDLRARLSRIHADSYVPDLAPLTVTSPVASPRVERVSVTSLNVCMMMITLVKLWGCSLVWSRLVKKLLTLCWDVIKASLCQSDFASEIVHSLGDVAKADPWWHRQLISYDQVFGHCLHCEVSWLADNGKKPAASEDKKIEVFITCGTKGVCFCIRSPG